MAELDKKGIPYSAKVSESTALSVRNTDKAEVDKTQKDLTATLNAAKTQKAEHTVPKKTTR